MKHWAKFILPGSFFNEDMAREVPKRSIGAALAVAPDGAFAFKFYDTAIADFEFDAGLFRVLPIPQNEGPTHYIGGTIYMPDELRLLASEEGQPTKYDILIANCEGNGWGRVIRTRAGNFQPFEDGDVLVDADA